MREKIEVIVEETLSRREVLELRYNKLQEDIPALHKKLITASENAAEAGIPGVYMIQGSSVKDEWIASLREHAEIYAELQALERIH
jgi:hypothetical protein